MGTGPEPPAAELHAALVPMVPVIVEAAITAIRAGDPGISTGGMERNLRLGLLDAVDRWFEIGPASPASDVHFRLGRAQARAERTLDELMSFYRIAGQTMWHRLTELGSLRGIPPEHLYRLAESGFGCFDEISTQATAGFVEEKSHLADAAQSRRGELLRLLLSEPPVSSETLWGAAQAAGIEYSPIVALYVGAAEDYDAFLWAGRELIVRGPRDGDFVGALFDPEAPERQRRIASAAEQAKIQLAIGPAGDHAHAPRSLALARRTLALSRAGLAAGDGHLALASQNSLALLLSGEQDLAGRLIATRLKPLEAIRGEKTRDNLTLTLRAWLRHPGQRKTIAHVLGVHPQTVRYRMANLRDLFGAALDDPDARFELDLALHLRAHQRQLP